MTEANLPRTSIPCLFPQVGQPDAGVIKVASTTPVANEAAFAVTLRALLGRTGEFAFLLGDRSVVWVDGLEEGQTTETLKVYDALDVVGLETVEAKLAFGNEDDTPSLKAPILFHLQVRPSSIALAYSKAHIPDSFAHQLVDMYLVEDGRSPISQDIVKDFKGLSVLNHPPRPYPNSTQKYTLLYEGFVAQAATNPEAIAVDFLGATDDVTSRQTITYAELDRKSSALSKFIRHIIPGEGKSIIPLALPPSTALYVGYLGVLRSGHAFCPLPGLDNVPVERIIELVGDVDAPLVLGLGNRPSWMAGMPSVAWKDINEIDEDVEGLEGHSPPKETALAYVLFTSGSTGKPKGVQISHLAVSASIASHLSVRSLPLGTRWFQFAASTFDPSLMEIFMNFSSGTTICAANRERFLTDPEAVLRELKCSHMMATPSMAALLRPEKIGDAFELWTMGEKLSDSVINAFSRPEKGYVLCNAYGPTEAAINVTLRVHPRIESGARLGAPIPTATMVILHPTEEKLMPLGFPGELGLAGVQLANGYLNMPEQTAKAFVQVEGIGRVYRTGDRARVVLDEVNKWSGIEYLGRMGMGQVKLAGRRVELGEIDAVLSAVAGIQAAHTVVLNEQLYTLITPASNDLIAKAEEVALARLPLHMRPVSYVLANSTPQSAAGKADRRAITKLIESFLAETKSDDDSLPPPDLKTLELVVRLVAEAADIDQRAITPSATLLALGVDSLRGVRFLRLARDAGVQGLEIQDLLGRATPISVARLITERSGQDSPETSNAHLQIIEDFIPQAAAAVRCELGISGEDALPKILPSTPMQASVLAVYLRTPERSTGYLNHSIYTLSSHVQIEPFKQAWEEVVRRNAILRTFFVLVDDSDISPFAQVVNKQPNIVWIESTGPDVDALVSKHLDAIPEHISTRTPSAVAMFSNEDKTDVRFALTLHHALFDGGSLALMLEELHSIYTASETRLQRAGFEHGIADALNANTEAYTQYWTEELKDFTPDSFPDLSGLRQEAKAPGHHVSTVISSLTFSDMREKARNIHATPLSVIQAAWALILLTYSESESPDIVFGSVIGGRTSEALEFTVGPVFSTVPVRIRNVEKATTKEVLSGLLEKNVSSLLNRYPPVKVLSGEKGFIYDTTIALQNFGEGLSQTELWTKAEYPPMETEFAIVLEIWVEQNDAIRLRTTCSNNVLIPSASEDMLRQFDNLISGILSSDYHDALFLDLVAAVDPSSQSSVNSVPQPRAIPSNQLIHYEFEDNCQRNPDSLALWFKHDLEHPECDLKWTYRELNARANRLAHYLVNTFGDVRDQAIPLCMEKCPELYVAILGIVKAGAAWCPVDAEAPEKRQKDLFSRAGGPVILVRNTSALATYEGACPENLAILALDDPRLSDQLDSNPVVDISPSHLAYLIWTSGTTGLPKGVPIEHKAAAQSLSALQEAIPFHNSGVRCLNFSAYIFDVSVLDVFYALGASCGTLCSSPKDVLLNQFVDVVNAFEATHAFLTPAFMAQSSLSECNTLQSLISIGEKLPDSVADKWCRPGTVSLNTYGPAEATIIATYRRFQPGEKTKAQNVGLPIQTVSCAAIKDGRVVPRGAVGELALGGYQNARGYHCQADMTAKKFIEHPVAGKVYMTGDIVRFLHDGTCEFVGRNDDLVKLGGVRVELSEISAVLKSCHPVVRDAATLHLSRPDRPQKVVCTFLAAPSLPGESNLCTDAKAAELASAAKQYAEQYLPLVMHPTVLVVVNNLPLTPSNKVDRRALTNIYVAMDILTWETALGGISNDSEPLSDTEATIQVVVSNLTGSPMEWIKKTTPFPALGVDSLRALQLASRLRKAGIVVSVRDILMHPSTAKLARCVDHESKVDRSTIPTISRPLQAFDAIWRPRLECVIDGMERVLPCTPLQEGMLGETVKNPSAYWSHRLFKLDCTLEVDRLIRSWELVATRTEVLRVVFLPAAAHVSRELEVDPTTVFLQAVLALPALQVSYKHCLDRDILKEATERASVIVKTWTGSHLPPWALTIFEQNEGERTMMLSIHHALYDGSAIQYLLDEVQLAYHGRPLGDHVQLTGALSASLFAHEAQESQVFWDNALTPFADADANPWPTLLDRSPASDEKSCFLPSSFRADRIALSQVASEVDASVGHVLQAAWSFVLAAYMGTSKVVFGETLSLRVGNASLERAIAPLITTTPVLAAVEESTTPRALIGQLARLSTNSSPHRLVSLQRIRKALQRQIHQPVFCAIFVIFTDEDEEEEDSFSLTPPDKLWSGRTEVTELGVEHPLAVNVYVSGTEVKVDVLGSSKFMLDSQIDLLARQFEAVLQAVVTESNTPFVALMVGLPEQYLSVVHRTQVATLGDLSLTHWLEKRAIVTPDLVAVATYGSSASRLTYKELDEASNRVAHWLQQRYRSSVIAFLMPRSASSIVYQLGIFKSGNIYFPIDDTIQPSRKRLLIRAGNAAVVLTASAFWDQFSQVENLIVVDVESSEHAREVSKCAAGPVSSVTTQSVACIIATGVHRTSSRLCTFSPRNINTTIEALVDRIGATVSTLGDNIFLSWMPSSLESSLIEFFLPIRLGMTIASVPQDDLRRDVVGTITETSATHIFLPPAWLQQEGVRKCDVPSLRCIVFIGPPLQTEVFQGEEELSHPLILTAFGFPETTSFSVVGQYQPAPTRILGHVLPHLTAVILEQGSFNVVVRGQIGELCLSGDSISTGYLHGSNTRFSDDPKFGRVFRTGCIVRLLANDSIQYIGQAHSALELVAKPVDPFTVSRLVQSLSPQRLNVYTTNLDHPEGLAKYLVTFISRSWDPLCTDVPSICSKDLPLARSLRGLCRRLPTHLVPDVVLPLDAIPLDNCLLGTVDDRALRRLFGRLSPDVLRDRNEQGAHKRPLTAVEEQIRHILSLSTGVSEAAIEGNTSTLELGIDSLTAISLSFRLKAEGFFVPPHVILAGPTLAVLAKSSWTPHKSARSVNASSVDDTLKQRIYQDFRDRNVQDVRRCLPLQEGLVARTLNSRDAVYVNHFILRIEEANPGRLRDAFTETVMANDILRTCFFAGDTEIVQVVLKDAPNLWRIRDAGHEDSLSLLKADMPSTEQDVVQHISQHAPIRLSLYSSHVAPTYVCLTMHHAIYDGESLPMLLSEVRDRYHQSFKIVRAPDTRLLDFLASQSRELAEAFFLEYLQDAPKPKNLLAGAVADPQRQQVVLGLPLSALEQASRVLNTSLHALLMTAYGIALGEHRGNTDSVFGVVLSGRTVLVDGVDTMLAPCITTVPIRVRVEEPQIFSDIASQTQLQTASVYEHQHTPLRIIQRWVGSAEPLFDTLFSYTKGRTVSASHHLWSLLESQAALDYPLALAVHADPDADTLTLHVGHDLKFGSVAAVERLLSRVVDLLLDMNQTVPGQIATSQSAPSIPTGPTYGSTTWSTEERLIRSIVARICNVDEALVSKETSFLHLGIDSITSIRLAQELRSEELAVPTFAIMQNPCIGALVDFLRSSTLGSTSENALREFHDIQAALVEKYIHSVPRLSDMDNIQAVFPATPLQTGMLTQSLSGVGSLYLVHHGFLLDAQVSPQRLRRAWESVIQSTEILRCSFFASADPDYPWIGAVHGHAPTQWEETTVSSEDALRALARDIENSVILQDEHAFRKPPISFHLIVAPEMTVLIASIHHSLYDGLSFSYILEDVAAAYHDVEIPKRPQFTDAVPFILHSSKDESNFWQTRLSGYTACTLPKNPTPDNDIHLARVDFCLPSGSLDDIKTMGVTVQAVALLAWGKTLATLVHSLDVVFGQVVAGRSIELQDSLRASGPLFNTIPFRFKLSDATWSNLDAVKAQHDLNVQAEPHQHVPLRRIQRDWRMATSSPESLFDTLFVFQQANDKSVQRSALWSGFSISEDGASAQYPVSLEVIHSGETIQLRAGCQNGVLLPASLQDTLSVLREVFLNIVTAPTDSVMAYPPQLQGLGPAASSVESVAPTYSHKRAESIRTLTTTEQTVRTIFSTILNLREDQIGVETPLYALGLDSVAAIQIAAKCRNEFGLNIAVADIFVGETIAGICQAYDAHRVSTEVAATVAQANVVSDEEKLQALNLLGVTEDMVDHVLPVLPGQLYHLAAWLTCGGTFYQPVFVYKVTAIPDVDKLRLAWKTLQSRHSVLRTSFVAISSSKAFQVVFREPDIELEMVECEGDFDQRVKEHVRAEYHTPSTLYTPPSRAKLVRVQDQYALLLTLHHATYDAWSVPRLVSDLCSLYERADCKSSANFADFVQYVHASSNRPAQADFWRSSLDGSYTSSLLPKQHESSDLKQAFLRTSSIVSSADELHGTCQAAGSSLQAVVLAVWGRIVQELTGAKSPILGVYHTGRAESFEGLEVLAGPCVNILPLQIPSQTTPVDSLNAARYIQGQLGKRTKYEQTALRDINDWVEHSGPLFNVFINLLWHGDKIRSLRSGDSLLESYSVGVPTEYTSEIPFELHTSVSGLDCSYLPKTGMYVDVVLNAQTNSLGIAIKCNEVLLDESELRDVVSRFADGVRVAVEELK